MRCLVIRQQECGLLGFVLAGAMIILVLHVWSIVCPVLEIPLGKAKTAWQLCRRVMRVSLMLAPLEAGLITMLFGPSLLSCLVVLTTCLVTWLPEELLGPKHLIPIVTAVPTLLAMRSSPMSGAPLTSLEREPRTATLPFREERPLPVLDERPCRPDPEKSVPTIRNDPKWDSRRRPCRSLLVHVVQH